MRYIIDVVDQFYQCMFKMLNLIYSVTPFKDNTKFFYPETLGICIYYNIVIAYMLFMGGDREFLNKHFLIIFTFLYHSICACIHTTCIFDC